MNKEKYLKQRNALLEEIENLIAEGKTEDADAKMKEVEALDEKWENIKKATANLTALKGSAKVTDIENRSIDIGDAKAIDTIQKPVPVNDDKMYETAWAKTMQGKKLDENE